MEQLFIPSENSLLVNKVNTEYPPSLSYEVNRGFEIQQLDGKPAAEKYFEILKGKIPEESYDKWIDRIKNKLIPLTVNLSENIHLD
jgi:hypothetical protein